MYNAASGGGRVATLDDGSTACLGEAERSGQPWRGQSDIQHRSSAVNAMRHILVVGLVVMFTSGCAVLAEENRHLARALDDNLAPDSTTAKIALAPVAIPVGFAALAVDGVLINPVAFAPESWDAATWAFEEVPYTGLGEIVVFPMRVVTFPVLFVYVEVFCCFVRH